MSGNYRKLNLKRKIFVRGARGQRSKRFKRNAKYIRENPENQIARDKANDPYHFSDSDDGADDLGMGLELSDLPFLNESNNTQDLKELIAFTQDSVRPFFEDINSCDESKLDDALAELRYSKFRGNQREAIKRILAGKSTLFISPTGSGKSLCYQLPALLYSRYKSYMTIVVSPLISLMEDQMNHFPSSLKAVSLHSGHNRVQRRRSIEMLMNGEAQVAFISPEAIVGGILELEDLKNLPPVGFVCIDEAHCLSEWSHNFRPAYLQFLKILHDQMNIKTYLGLTATATRSTALTIAKNLRIDVEKDIVGKTAIPDNLLLSVSYEDDKDSAIVRLLKSPTFVIMPSIIVYCGRREDTERVAARIRTSMQGYASLIEKPKRVSTKSTSEERDTENAENHTPEKSHIKLTWNSEAYHAGLAMETRRRIQRQFIKGEIRVIVATVAFGMGVNKDNIRAVIHYDMPSSFENYVQEIGRAGRDGKPAQCHMFLKSDKTDIFYQQRNIYSSVTERKNLRKLVEYVFKPCKCYYWLKKHPKDLQEFEDLNARSEPHILPRFCKLTNSAQHDLGKENESTSSTSNVSQVQSVRCCRGHEVTFPIEEASKQVNLKPESIMTLICQLEQAYPQLGITQYTPIKSDCTIFCYKGSSQMEKLAKTSRVVGEVVKLDRLKNRESNEPVPSKITFDVVKIASLLGKSSGEVVKLCKATEWEVVEKTGKFRRSQVRVTFDVNSFHLKSVGDLNEQELDEIYSFLCDYCSQFENIERDKIVRVFNTFRKFSVDLEQMNNKEIRLDISSKLKEALNTYFDSSSILAGSNETVDDSSNNMLALPEVDSKYKLHREMAARKTARAFISTVGRNFNPRNIARIFQGISTPLYPAEHWGLNKKWWRAHLDLDFIRLTEIIKEEQLS